ncbi:hypothetical protein [Sphingobacterium deserti]|uniref:Phosphatidate cytidylyltransferase n=1 Tax=Sphingobacterium deserti TaxID=1229276 RepID=A0A0B8T8R5_9SPHI|nr:hypothetical protein [Sphingobacterium deserti]KGE14340.1 hypothetical protein DI53_1954 [Sphingobacterium deserti]
MQRFLSVLIFLCAMAMMSSCQVVDVVFHTGAWSGVIFIILISIAIVWILARILGKRRKQDWTKP